MRLPLSSWPLCTSLLFTAVFLGACAVPSYRPALSEPAVWSDDEAEIRAALREAEAAWNRGDLRGHLAMYADSTTFMTGAGPRAGVDFIEAAFLQTFWEGGQPKQRLRFEQVTVRRLDRGAALATGRFVLSGGGAPEQSGWYTTAWVRTPAGWHVVHDHSS